MFFFCKYTLPDVYRLPKWNLGSRKIPEFGPNGVNLLKTSTKYSSPFLNSSTVSLSNISSSDYMEGFKGQTWAANNWIWSKLNTIIIKKNMC